MEFMRLLTFWVAHSRKRRGGAKVSRMRPGSRVLRYGLVGEILGGAYPEGGGPTPAADSATPVTASS